MWFFFFQAEDGIRDRDVTGVQTCALPILPPGFPPTEIEGEHYWDGGLVSNTPLEWVLDRRPGRDTLAFQIDQWSARGEFPRNLVEAETRQKEIRYSSRTRLATNQFKKKQILRRAAARLLAKIQ